MAINLDIHGNTQPLEQAVQAAVTRIRKTPIKITVDDKGVTQPLGNMKRGADEFSKSMEAANARIIAFGASMAIINGIADAFKGLVRNVVEVEKALQDINVVMGLSTDNLDRFSSGLFRVAKETGAAFKVAAEAATEYARQGLSMEESLKRTRDALILTRITGMDSAEAVKALTAAMNTYGSQIKDTTELVSKFAAVDVKFAVSAEDFADAIARTGQAAKGAGVSIDELIGLVTAAQQTTARGGKVIGNSFKTIFTRIGRTTTLDQLEDIGIAVRDLEGNTISATKILTDLANTFDTLSAAQQAQIAQTVGGVFQINVLKAVLGDAAKQNGILAEATQISSNATDDAIQKNEMLRQTMSAMASETGLALKEVSAKIGEIMLAPGMEKILNMVKGVAEGVNNMLGDGEEGGNKFAKGFLAGIGNILTGPGLIIITAVFGKLLFKAFQYARDSLKSLIGITSEAGKQKAIQSSLVSLFGRSAELNKEMLRTDISRIQKEKTILELLHSQVAEAELLNAVAARASKTLYGGGYRADLSKKKASGHIPNFAERDQAARAGYAAGNIRSMNMPGQGTVIYNSAEQVKNFAGLKQPGILPPKGSNAGRNYRQGFGDVHGFDPYAAGGYVPNFQVTSAKGRGAAGAQKTWGTLGKGMELEAGKPFDATRLFSMLTLQGGLSGSGISTPPKGLYGMKELDAKGKSVPKSFPQIKFDMQALKKSAIKGTKGGRLEDLVGSLMPGASRIGADFANSLNLGPNKGPVRTATPRVMKALLQMSSSGAKGAMASVAGSIFEASIVSRLRGAGRGAKVTGGQLMPTAKTPIALGGDFDARGLRNFKIVRELFGPVNDIGDYKTAANEDTKKSFAKKVAKEMIFRKHPAFVGAGAGKKGLYRDKHGNPIFGSKSDEEYKSLYKGVKRGAPTPDLLSGSYGGLYRRQAGGFIPNFASGLGNAIGRERSAGVPISQIRVGSNNKLRDPGNPFGLGVTNTKDEPGGLKDIFGASSGFIPNFAEVKESMLEKVFGASQKKLEALEESLHKFEGTAGKAAETIDGTKQEISDLNESVEGLETSAAGKIEKAGEERGAFTEEGKAETSEIKKQERIKKRKEGELAGGGLSDAERGIKEKEIAVIKKDIEQRKADREVWKKSSKAKTEEINELKGPAKRERQRLRSTEARLSRENDRLATARAESQRVARQSATAQRRTQRMQTMRSGMGMASMIGLPMIAGQLQAGGAEKGGAGYIAGGGMTGAASGAMMGMMMAPMLGPLAPFAPAIGGAIGALYGLVDASDEASKAQREATRKKEDEIAVIEMQNTLSVFSGAMSKGMFEAAMEKPIGDMSTRLAAKANIGGVAGVDWMQFDKIQEFNLDIFERIQKEMTDAQKNILGMSWDPTHFDSEKVQMQKLLNLAGGKRKELTDKGTGGEIEIETGQGISQKWFGGDLEFKASKIYELAAQGRLGEHRDIFAGAGPQQEGPSVEREEALTEGIKAFEAGLKKALYDKGKGKQVYERMQEGKAVIGYIFMEEIAMYEKAMEEGGKKYKAETFRDFIIAASMDEKKFQDSNKAIMAKQLMLRFAEAADPDTKFLMSQTEAGPDDKPVKTTKPVSRDVLINLVKKLGPEDPAKTFELLGSLADPMRKGQESAKEFNEGIIKQLNFQKIQIRIQSRAISDKRKLDEKYTSFADKQNLHFAIMGTLHDKLSKAMPLYILGIEKATRDLGKARVAAEEAYVKSVVAGIHGDDTLFANLKKAMSLGTTPTAAMAKTLGPLGDKGKALSKTKTQEEFEDVLAGFDAVEMEKLSKILIGMSGISAKTRRQFEAWAEKLKLSKKESNIIFGNTKKHLGAVKQISEVEGKRLRIKEELSRFTELTNLQRENKLVEERLALETKIIGIRLGEGIGPKTTRQKIALDLKVMNEQFKDAEKRREAVAGKKMIDVALGDKSGLKEYFQSDKGKGMHKRLTQMSKDTELTPAKVKAELDEAFGEDFKGAKSKFATEKGWLDQGAIAQMKDQLRENENVLKEKEIQFDTMKMAAASGMRQLGGVPVDTQAMDEFLQKLHAGRDDVFRLRGEIKEAQAVWKQGTIELTKQNEELDGTLAKINEIMRADRSQLTLQELLLRAKIEMKEIDDKRVRGELAGQTIGGKTYGTAFQEGMKDARVPMQEEINRFEHTMGTTVANGLRDGLVGAMQAAINKSEDLGDALRNVALGFLQSMQDVMLRNAANLMITNMFGGMGGASRGGAVRGYAQGGGVSAMVSNGEYVMNRNAVNKYGGGFMHSLNARGKIPGYAVGGRTSQGSMGGGEDLLGGTEYGDDLWRKKHMSGFFFSGESGNVRFGEGASKAKEVLSERARKAAEKKAKKRAFWQGVAGLALSFGLNWAMGGFGGGAAAATGTGATGNIGGGASITPTGGRGVYGGSGVMESRLDLSDARLAQMFPNSRGGAIRKYAPGGYVNGKSGIDQIPAMLSEGEYVIRNSSVQQLGKPLLDRINAGKFQQGGEVTPISGDTESSVTGGMTNNINISVNVDKSGGESKKDEDAGKNPAEASDENEKNRKLGERIKAQVVYVIREEQRPGGLLG